MDIREFVDGVRPASGREATLFIGYFIEVVSEQGHFTTAEIISGFRDARLAAPQNLSDTIAKLRRVGLVIELAPKQYALSQEGMSRVVSRLKDTGWLTSEPTEPTQLIREVSDKLHQDVLAIADPAQREFVEEALTCLHPTVNAYRAAIIMAWSAAVHNLRGKLVSKGLAAVDTEVKKHFPKKKATKAQDLEHLKDSELLTVCQGLGILNKNVRKELAHLLDVRNGCAHPTGIRPQLHAVKAFFEELIQYVLAVP